MTEINQLREDLRIDQTNLSEEIVKQPGLFAYYAQQLSDIERKVKMAKLEFEVYESALDRKLRDLALASNKKLSERQIETAMYGDGVYIEKKRNLIELETQADQVKAIVESMRQKKDMLITISTNIRAEMNQGFAIRADAKPDVDKLYPKIVG